MQAHELENSRINLMQDGQDFYTENYKIFRKCKEELVNIKVLEHLSALHCENQLTKYCIKYWNI